MQHVGIEGTISHSGAVGRIRSLQWRGCTVDCCLIRSTGLGR